MTPNLIRLKPVPFCPECEQPMVLRQPKSDDSWPAFWGCSDYPRCKGTRDILPNGEPEDDEEDAQVGEIWET